MKCGVVNPWESVRLVTTVITMEYQNMPTTRIRAGTRKVNERKTRSQRRRGFGLGRLGARCGEMAGSNFVTDIIAFSSLLVYVASARTGSPGKLIAGRARTLTALALLVSSPVLLCHALALLQHLHVAFGMKNKLYQVT